MSGNNVKITEQGHLVVGNVGIPAAVVPAIEAHYRAKFAAERMPEDVQNLVNRADEWLADHRQSPSWRLIYNLHAALEAAYSKESSDEPR